MDWTRYSPLVLWLALVLSIDNGNAEQRVVCYYTNWSVYRPGTAKFSPQNINPYLCTHLIYAFGGFTKDNTLKPFDKYQDIEKGGYAKFTGLKTYNKKLKTMLAVGGWNEGSSRFSPMVADPDRRQQFVRNAVKFLRQNHFDGLDLDWEYPAFRDGGKPRDRDNYADLVQELREEFERESSKTGRPRLLLSMAIPAGIEYLEKGYDLPRLNEYLDFFNLLSYDYHSAFEPAVNHHAPLYGLEEANEYNYDSELTIDYTISYLIKHDVSPEKIVLGIPTYGRSYTLFNSEATDIGSPADGPGEEGDATREKGYLAYYEICENIAKSDEWQVIQPNPKAMGPYAFKDNQWVGYDDEAIVRVKALYVNEKGLGGIMFWSIDNDDFRGKCHDRAYPLIEAAKEAMLAGNEKRQPSNKSTVDNRKKARPHSDSQRTQDNNSRRRFTTESTKRRTSTTTVTPRRKTTLQNKFHSRTKSRVDIDDENDEQKIVDIEEENDNVVKESTSRNRNRTRPRNRANRVGGRKKPQASRQDDDDDDSGSVSNKLTTPEPPTTPDPGSDFKCEDEGFFSHPRDCKKYFWCLDSGPGGLGIVAHQFTCPSGLVFNKAADSCDYPRNVICPKVKSVASTTRAPITAATSRTTYLYTTKKTTTTAKPNEAEEYEYYDEDSNSAEDDLEVEEPIKSTTTARPLIYKSINRSKPTTTSTTEAPPTTTLRSFKPTDKVLDLEEEEDPRVIKELIDLIKKAGGLDQLEKQLNLQGKSPLIRVDTTESEERVTPATISRSLYERVLNRQATRVVGLFGTSTPRTTTTNTAITNKPTRSKVKYQNGPGGSQFQGLDDIPEVQSLRRITNKHQYVTIERQRPSTQASVSDEETDDALADQEEIEEDNPDVASSEDQSVSNLPENVPKRAGPNYVNIRRARPTTPSNENDLENKDETLSTSTSGSNEEPERRVQPEKESSIPKSRYTNIQRFRSTTSRSDEITSTEAIKVDEITPETIDSTTLSNNQVKLVSENPIISSTEIPLSSTTTTKSPEQTSIATETTLRIRSTTVTTSSQQPTTEPTVTLNENFVTDTITLTTPLIMTSKNTSQTPLIRTTTVVSQPRPFGFPRRGRPTTSTSIPSINVSSTTEQSRAKIVSESPIRPVLPTLKELIDHEIAASKNLTNQSTIIDNEQIDPVLKLDETRSPLVNENSQDILIPVRILTDNTDGNMIDNQYAILHLLNSQNSTIRQNILRIQVIDEQVKNNVNEKTSRASSQTEIKSVTSHQRFNSTVENIFPHNGTSLRGFYVTKSLDAIITQTTDVTNSFPTLTTDTFNYDTTEDSSDVINEINTTTMIYQQSDFTDNKIDEINFTETTTSSATSTDYNDFSSTHQSLINNNINDLEYEIVTTTENIDQWTTVPQSQSTETLLPINAESQERKHLKQLIVLRRPIITSIHSQNSNDTVTSEKSAKSTKWNKKIIRKRPIVESMDDQSIAESNPQVNSMVLPPSLDHEVNLFRSGATLRRPGSIVRHDTHDRFKLKTSTNGGTSSEKRYSSKIKADTYDQSGRAQELAVSVADPPTVTSSVETGREIPSRYRGIQRHIRVDTRSGEITEPPPFTRTTISSARRRQRPNSESIRVETTSSRPRRPAIIDYDYYVDEEVRLSIRPELKDKIYITRGGGIGCLDQGNFAHPTSCKKFITCARMVSGQVVATEYTCPDKLSFDPVGGICNWSAGLGCKEQSFD